jgi:small GTP-binding protein
MVMGGQGGVGKTTILYRFVHREFVENMKLTIGVDFHKKVIVRNGYSIELVLWDLGGQEQFRDLHDGYIKGSTGGFVCFDMSRRPTLDYSREWITMFQTCIPDMPILLVGTKYDLIENDSESYKTIVEDANALVKEYGLLGFVITSAKSNLNVDETIYYMIDSILYSMKV